MVTDIFDKHLKGIREQRWERAFYSEDHLESDTDMKNRKATIVIEHIIQVRSSASAVNVFGAHTDSCSFPLQSMDPFYFSDVGE